MGFTTNVFLSFDPDTNTQIAFHTIPTTVEDIEKDIRF